MRRQNLEDEAGNSEKYFLSGRGDDWRGFSNFTRLDSVNRWLKELGEIFPEILLVYLHLEAFKLYDSSWFRLRSLMIETAAEVGSSRALWVSPKSENLEIFARSSIGKSLPHWIPRFSVCHVHMSQTIQPLLIRDERPRLFVLTFIWVHVEKYFGILHAQRSLLLSAYLSGMHVHFIMLTRCFSDVLYCFCG